jgi:nitroimidazol reductase NimA-like FMN-containing flavoprotein (pyridoxamine 5'-phosphate oxidase superfamily)
MVGELKQEQIDQFLHSQAIGRLGCYAEVRTYVVPINYAYDGQHIYARSINGMKLQIMRLNPEVCFEVDHIITASNWQSVIAWGTFEKLQGEEAANALRLLVKQLMTQIASGQSLHFVDPQQHTTQVPRTSSIYRIHLTEKTGRFEKDDE